MITVLKKNDNEKLQQILCRNTIEKNDVQKIVDEILYAVKTKGNKALFEYTKQFDGIEITEQNIKVTQQEFEYAYEQVPKELIKVIQKSAQRIRNFHQKQKINSWLEPSENGEMLGQLIRPIAKEAGVNEVYKVGGAQAIAALAYGTTCVPKVDKICGPGNIYVALAKKGVYGQVNIDSIAGPSEILVIADDSANAVYVAADMLSQAEHDEMASAILVTDSEKLAEEVKKELYIQTEQLERKEIILKSLENYGLIVIAKDMKQACELSNRIAPEHMEICTKAPFELLPYIKNAGAIFLGHYTPEPLGDYMAGPNHVLPTGGTARFFSPLSLDDFIKKSSILSFSKEAFLELSDDVMTFAKGEGLTAHANAVSVRKEK